MEEYLIEYSLDGWVITDHILHWPLLTRGGEAILFNPDTHQVVLRMNDSEIINLLNTVTQQNKVDIEKLMTSQNRVLSDQIINQSKILQDLVNKVNTQNGNVFRTIDKVGQLQNRMDIEEASKLANCPQSPTIKEIKGSLHTIDTKLSEIINSTATIKEYKVAVGKTVKFYVLLATFGLLVLNNIGTLYRFLLEFVKNASQLP